MHFKPFWVPSLHIKFINSRVDCSQKLYKKTKRISIGIRNPLFDFIHSFDKKSKQKMSLLDATIWNSGRNIAYWRNWCCCCSSNSTFFCCCSSNSLFDKLFYMVIGWNIEKKRKKDRKKSLLEELALTDVHAPLNTTPNITALPTTHLSTHINLPCSLPLHNKSTS